MVQWILRRHGWVFLLVPAVLVLAGTVFLDRQNQRELDSARREAATEAERRGRLLSNELENTINGRLGAMAAAKLRFTPVEDMVSERMFTAALDSATSPLVGLTAISVIYDTAHVSRGTGAAFGVAGFDLSEPQLAAAYRRALDRKQPAATGVVDANVGRRVFVFDPVIRGDSVRVEGVLVAELDPGAILRIALADARADTMRSALYSLYGPEGTRLTTVPAPADWPTVEVPVRVVDTRWLVRFAYQPVAERGFQSLRVGMWVSGLAIALALTAVLMLLRRTVITQREELARRKAAEEEARARMLEARELAVQLEAAHKAAQRLSTSLEPDDVLELFLGGVGEILGADVASVYTFDEEGEVLVGRKRMVLRDVGPVTERLKKEDIRQVRAAVALLPLLAEAVSTGEPCVVEDAAREGRTVASATAGPESAPASVTVPLMVAGHVVGVASWEVLGGPRSFERANIAFAQALAAPAAAALRTAELFTSLEAARARATRESIRFATLLDQMADGVLVVDAQGYVERSNKAAEELLGPGIGNVPLRDWTSYYRLASAEGRPYTPVDFPLSRALRGERVRRASFVLSTPMGDERRLSGSAAPILTPTGELTGAAMVFRDVTDEHQYAEMLRHTNRELREQAELLEQVNRELRRATEAKDQFLAVMSHELRTPINAIMGYADLLDLGVRGALNADQRAMLARIRETSKHLLGLINDVLDLAKIGAGQVELAMRELELGSIVERATQQMLPIAAAKGLTVSVQGPAEGAPVRLMADETRLAQVLLNLLSNAVKFTQTGSVTVRFYETADSVFVRVKDTGPGIPAELRDRIFEEFYQAESGLSRTATGTGLGLAIARRFTRLMGGDIRVESEAGTGSEFIVQLPGMSEREKQVGEQPNLVLLARDETALAQLLKLLRGHARVLGSTQPSRILTLVRRSKPDLVVLDMLAPNHGAWRALSALQSEGGMPDVRLLLLVADPLDTAAALDLGAVTAVARPDATERLVEGVRRYANGRGTSVLLAEDDNELREQLTRVLSDAGFHVALAQDGNEAVAVMVSVMPSVVVLDLSMPGQDAVSTLVRMRSDPALRSTPVILLVERELGSAEMRRLQQAVEGLVRAADVPVRPLAEVIIDACAAPPLASSTAGD